MTKINTVQGTITPEQLGITSIHEHVIADFSALCKSPRETLRKTFLNNRVKINNIGFLRRNIFAIKDNLLLNNIHLAVKELLEYKKAGGHSIVDVTPKNMGRNPLALKTISNHIGLPIIVGCGYYTEETHPSSISRMTSEEIAAEMINEIKQGINGTHILPGVIGEIGTSKIITRNEEKILRAAAQAQLETDLTIIVHPYTWGKTGRQILDILRQERVPLNRVVMSHMDCNIDLDYHKYIAGQGAYLAFDNFGKEEYVDSELWQNHRDTERIEALHILLNEGYIGQILIAQDTAFKMDLHKYGGWGYDHILSNITPRLMRIGITKEQIQQILVMNPKRALTGMTV